MRHIDSLNDYDSGRSLPFVVNSEMVGRIRRPWCEVLSAFTEFTVTADEVRLKAGDNPASRTALLADAAQRLAEQGYFKLRNEPYRVATSWDTEPVATLDRGAVQFFGIASYGVHVNGVVERPDGHHMWIARRARDRMTWPGMLDNMIGGGLAAAYTAEETLIKEADEEAGFGPEIAGKAKPVGFLSYAVDTDHGVRRDGIFAYDLVMSEDLIPISKDGEVERFDLMPIEDVTELVAHSDQFKPNCNLVIIDFLIRHGYLKPDTKGYVTLANGLKSWI
jgi:isopentenyldiphosphate isomerase